MSSGSSDKKSKATTIAGLITGGINKFLVHPIDTVKAKLQVKISY